MIVYVCNFMVRIISLCITVTLTTRLGINGRKQAKYDIFGHFWEKSFSKSPLGNAQFLDFKAKNDSTCIRLRID